MSKIAILADSGCQIPFDTDHPGIYIAPLSITIKENSYLDQINITSLDVFHLMDSEDIIVKTSQPSTGELIKVLEKIKQDGYDEVIGISIATGLSSTLNGMKVASDMVEIPITLVDSKGTALIHRYLVEVAAKLVQEGKESVIIKEILDEMVKDSRTIIMAPNLEHLKRGGRITPAVAMLGGMLRIVPVMELNHDLGGKIDTLTKVRTVKKASLTLVHRMIELGVNAKDYCFAIEHVLAGATANILRDELISQIGPCDIVVRELPAVVGAHMGIGGIGVQFIKKYKES